MTQPTITYTFPNDHDHTFDIECHTKAVKVQLAIYDVLGLIRTKLKHGDPSNDERELLETIRTRLLEHYVEG